VISQAGIRLLRIVPDFVVMKAWPEGPARIRRRREKDPGKLYSAAGQRLGRPLAMDTSSSDGHRSSTVATRAPAPNVIDRRPASQVLAGTRAHAAREPKLRIIAFGTAKRLHTCPDVASLADGLPGIRNLAVVA